MFRQDCQNTPPQLGKQLNAYVSHAAFKGYVERVMQIMKLTLTVIFVAFFFLGISWFLSFSFGLAPQTLLALHSRSGKPTEASLLTTWGKLYPAHTSLVNALPLQRHTAFRMPYLALLLDRRLLHEKQFTLAFFPLIIRGGEG